MSLEIFFRAWLISFLLVPVQRHITFTMDSTLLDFSEAVKIHFTMEMTLEIRPDQPVLFPGDL